MFDEPAGPVQFNGKGVAAAPNPWDRPKHRADQVSSTATQAALHGAIGSAIVQWAVVEHMLASMSVSSFSNRSGQNEAFHQAASVYAAMPSSAARLNALRTVSACFFERHPERAAYLKKLIAVTELFLARRNDIAHGGCY